MKKIYMLYWILAFIIPLSYNGLAQNVVPDQLPYAINSAGGYSTMNKQHFDFSIGEMVLIETFSVGSNTLTQGFLQPYFVGYTNTMDVIVENNVLTPNADGKNDVFVLLGLEKYPLHKLSIFDRAGRIVYRTTNYQSNWDGKFQGFNLNEDTYYFILDSGDSRVGVMRGFISIISDINK